MSYRIVIVSWRIVMHTLCGRDVLVFCWIVDMLDMSYRIVIVSWRIVMHTMCERYLLLDGRISVHIMRSRDLLG
jgi:hypothetical protein